MAERTPEWRAPRADVKDLTSDDDLYLDEEAWAAHLASLLGKPIDGGEIVKSGRNRG